MVSTATSKTDKPLIWHLRVAWITAIHTEYVAARHMLDEEYEGVNIAQLPNDDYIFTLGRIGNINLVIATLPPEGYGNLSASSLARSLKANFPFIQSVLMVGVGGGAPTSDNELRLGDVVVSSKIIHYGFVKRSSEGEECIGGVYKASTYLLTGTSLVNANIVAKKLNMRTLVSETFEGSNENIVDMFQRPDDDSDRLYPSDYPHVESTCACTQKETRDLPRPITRELRKSHGSIKVHWGPVGTADTVLKDAIRRDELVKKHNILCVEMESAGLLETFPEILSIRGVCDYADSHKNKQWQGYAAAVAATYAKCLLGVLRVGCDPQVTAEEMQAYTSAVCRLVNRVALDPREGSGGELKEVHDAMNEVKQNIQILVQQAERHKKTMDKLNSEQTQNAERISEANTQLNKQIKESTKEMEKILQGQKDMEESLFTMKEYIRERQRISPPEQREHWNNLNEQANEGTSSLQYAAKSTMKTLNDTKDTFDDITVLTRNPDMKVASETMGRVQGIWGILDRLGGTKLLEKKDKSKTSWPPTEPASSSPAAHPTPPRTPSRPAQDPKTLPFPPPPKTPKKRPEAMHNGRIQRDTGCDKGGSHAKGPAFTVQDSPPKLPPRPPLPVRETPPKLPARTPTAETTTSCTSESTPIRQLEERQKTLCPLENSNLPHLTPSASFQSCWKRDSRRGSSDSTHSSTASRSSGMETPLTPLSQSSPTPSLTGRPSPPPKPSPLSGNQLKGSAIRGKYTTNLFSGPAMLQEVKRGLKTVNRLRNVDIYIVPSLVEGVDDLSVNQKDLAGLLRAEGILAECATRSEISSRSFRASSREAVITITLGEAELDEGQIRIDEMSTVGNTSRGWLVGKHDVVTTMKEIMSQA